MVFLSRSYGMLHEGPPSWRNRKVWPRQQSYFCCLKEYNDDTSTSLFSWVKSCSSLLSEQVIDFPIVHLAMLGLWMIEIKMNNELLNNFSIRVFHIFVVWMKTIKAAWLIIIINKRVFMKLLSLPPFFCLSPIIVIFPALAYIRHKFLWDGQEKQGQNISTKELYKTFIYNYTNISRRSKSY